MKLQNILDTVPFDGLKIKKIVNNETGDIIIISLEKGSELKSHTSNTDASVFVLEGSVKFKIKEEEFILEKNDIYTFKKDEIHAVEGITNSKLLLIK